MNHICLLITCNQSHGKKITTGTKIKALTSITNKMNTERIKDMKKNMILNLLKEQRNLKNNSSYSVDNKLVQTLWTILHQSWMTFLTQILISLMFQLQAFLLFIQQANQNQKNLKKTLIQVLYQTSLLWPRLQVHLLYLLPFQQQLALHSNKKKQRSKIRT